MKSIHKYINQNITFYLVIVLLLFSSTSYNLLIQDSRKYMDYISSNKTNKKVQIPQKEYKEPESDEQPQKINLCPACNFTPLYPPSSSKRDVVLAAALNSITRAEVFLRTLRMTGSRCRIILFLDSKQSIEPFYLRFFKSCEIEPVYVDNRDDKVIIGGSKMTRYYYYHQWLSKHINEVDRVLHSDTFDVFFQSDPFREEMLPLHSNNVSNIIEIVSKERAINFGNIKINVKISQRNPSSTPNYYFYDKDATFDGENLLYVSVEPVKLHSSVYTAIWFSKCYGNLMNRYYQMQVSCSGVTLGYSKAFLTYLNVLFEKSNWTRCFGDSLDQAHHNYIIYHRDLQNKGIIIKGLDCNSEILTMHFCCRYANCHLNDQTNIFYGNNSNKAPIIVHQYNRLESLVKRNIFFCPKDAKTIYYNASDDLNKSSISDADDLAKIERLPPFNFKVPKNLS